VGGILPSGTKIVSKVIDGAKWEKHWATSVSALKSLPSIADGNSLIPNDRLYSVLGSVNYRDVFLKAEKELNMIKGRIFYMKPDGNGLLQNTFAAPQAEKAFNGFLQAAIKTGSGENAFFHPIRRVSPSFLSRDRNKNRLTYFASSDNRSFQLHSSRRGPESHQHCPAESVP
jgi:hypothetical protein